jgi:hypothetical protein
MSLISVCEFCRVELCRYCLGVRGEERCKCEHKIDCLLFQTPESREERPDIRPDIQRNPKPIVESMSRLNQKAVMQASSSPSSNPDWEF